MITKDRYSKAIIIFVAGFILAMIFLKKDKGLLAFASVFTAILPLAWNMTRPARIHITPDQVNRLKPEFKGETECGFTHEPKTKVDGIRMNGTRYKFVNGTDVCIDRRDHVKPCGFGSAFMLGISGMKEPQAIQNDPCWK
jgi:hypothetical protein